MADHNNITVWIRPEDADHPKLERLRRAVDVAIGPDNDATRPWVVWGTGLSRAWLFAKLEAGAQVLVLPPWADGGFAGLPPFRSVTAPTVALQLQNYLYAVGAIEGIEPSPAWQEYGRFEKSKIAWLVAHEPFVGAGRAWLCTAELLVSTPTTRPREARRLAVDLLSFIAGQCLQPAEFVEASDQPGPVMSGFSQQDAPYLVGFLGLPGPRDATQTAQFIHRRLGLQPDLATIERLLGLPVVQIELQQPVGQRMQLAQIVDAFGMRSFRIEIEETA